MSVIQSHVWLHMFADNSVLSFAFPHQQQERLTYIADAGAPFLKQMVPYISMQVMERQWSNHVPSCVHSASRMGYICLFQPSKDSFNQDQNYLAPSGLFVE